MCLNHRITPRRIARLGRAHWSALAFLILFTLLIIWIVPTVLVPGMQAATRPGVTATEKHNLVAWYRLLLAIILFVLFAGLVLTVRFGRFFFPRSSGERTQTKYVDAWKAAADRMETPPKEDDEDGAADEHE